MFGRKKEKTIYKKAHLIPMNQDDESFFLKKVDEESGYKTYELISCVVKQNETPSGSIVAAAKDITGMIVSEESLDLVHRIHRKENKEEYEDYFFITNMWAGKAVLLRTDLYDAIEWRHMFDIPYELLPYMQQGLYNGVNYRSDFSEFGWGDEDDKRI